MELICPEAGWRLDQYLAQAVPGLTRSAWWSGAASPWQASR